MKRFSLVIAAVVFTVCLNGCADHRAQSSAAGKPSKKQKTFAETQTAELVELAKEPVRTTAVSRREQARLEKDNSVVETMYDSFGNKVESRVFHDDLLLKMVVRRTSADGQHQALIYGNNGEVKPAPQNLLDRVLTSAAGEIAKAVEIFEGRKENAMLAKSQTAKLLLKEISPTEDFDSQIIRKDTLLTDNAPPEKNNVPSQTIQSGKDDPKIVNSEDAVSKLKSSVQSLKLRRVNAPAKN